MQAWADSYSEEVYDNTIDPVWNAKSDYTLLKDPSKESQIYIRNTDQVIEYIVDKSDATHDIVIYFPDGLA